MTVVTESLAPEFIAQMREIAYQVFQEQREDILQEFMGEELGRLRVEYDRQMKRVWQALEVLAEHSNRLEATVHALAEAQKRTEEQVRALAEAQKRTEERLNRLETVVQELAEAQKRTEERLNRLEATVQELAEAQKRTEERLNRLEATVQELAEAQKRTEEQIAQLVAAQQRTERRLDLLDHRVGLIANALGVDTEVDAQEVLLYVLEQKGYQLLEPPRALDLDGEIDVAVPVETPEGERAWVLVEAKARAKLKGLRRWAERLTSPGFIQRLEDVGVTRPLLFYLFGLRVYQIVENEARKLGLGVLDPDGERVAPTLIR